MKDSNLKLMDQRVSHTHFVGSEASVGIKDRLYLTSNRPGVTTEYCSDIVVSRIILSVISDRQAIGG